MVLRVACLGVACCLLFGVNAFADEPVLPDVLVTRQLAARAHLAVGDVVAFTTDQGGAPATRFRVAGIYEPTPDPMRFTAQRMEARMHLPDLTRMTMDSTDPASAESVTQPKKTLPKPPAAISGRGHAPSGEAALDAAAEANDFAAFQKTLRAQERRRSD